MRPVGYLVATFPVLSETFVGEEIRAVSQRRPLSLAIMNLSTAPAQPGDLALAESATLLRGIPASRAIAGALRPGARCLSALWFAARQQRLPRLSLIWNGWKLAALWRANGCAHVHAHFAGGAAAHAIFAARWGGMTVSFVCHGHDFYVEPQDIRIKLRNADEVVAVCEDLTRDLCAVEPRAKVSCVPCGVDPDRFTPGDRKETNGRLLFIGRLVPEKGVAELLDALTMTRARVKVDIVGDGALRRKLEDRAAALGLQDRVAFLGARDRTWIGANAGAYEALVAPFRRGPDGSQDTGPLVVKEAMAMAIPVITSRFMGMKQTVTEDTGFLAEPGNPQSLAEQIDALFAMEPLARRAMGARGRTRMLERFTTHAQADRLLRVFGG